MVAWVRLSSSERETVQMALVRPITAEWLPSHSTLPRLALSEENTNNEDFYFQTPEGTKRSEGDLRSLLLHGVPSQA